MERVELRLHPKVHYRAVADSRIGLVPFCGPGDVRFFGKEEGNIYWIVSIDSHHVARVVHVNEQGEYEVHLENGSTQTVPVDSSLLVAIAGKAKRLPRSHGRLACSQRGVDALVAENVLRGILFSYENTSTH